MSDETIPQEIRLPLAQALDIMETLRMASLWCGPKPEDWKPEKMHAQRIEDREDQT